MRSVILLCSVLCCTHNLAFAGLRAFSSRRGRQEGVLTPELGLGVAAPPRPAQTPGAAARQDLQPELGVDFPAPDPVFRLQAAQPQQRPEPSLEPELGVDFPATFSMTIEVDIPLTTTDNDNSFEVELSPELGISVSAPARPSAPAPGRARLEPELGIDVPAADPVFRLQSGTRERRPQPELQPELGVDFSAPEISLSPRRRPLESEQETEQGSGSPAVQSLDPAPAVASTNAARPPQPELGISVAAPPRPAPAVLPAPVGSSTRTSARPLQPELEPELGVSVAAPPRPAPAARTRPAPTRPVLPEPELGVSVGAPMRPGSTRTRIAAGPEPAQPATNTDDSFVFPADSDIVNEIFDDYVVTSDKLEPELGISIDAPRKVIQTAVRNNPITTPTTSTTQQARTTTVTKTIRRTTRSSETRRPAAMTPAPRPGSSPVAAGSSPAAAATDTRIANRTPRPGPGGVEVVGPKPVRFCTPLTRSQCGLLADPVLSTALLRYIEAGNIKTADINAEFGRQLAASLERLPGPPQVLLFPTDLGPVRAGVRSGPVPGATSCTARAEIRGGRVRGGPRQDNNEILRPGGQLFSRQPGVFLQGEMSGDINIQADVAVTRGKLLFGQCIRKSESVERVESQLAGSAAVGVRLAGINYQLDYISERVAELSFDFRLLVVSRLAGLESGAASMAGCRLPGISLCRGLGQELAARLTELSSLATTLRAPALVRRAEAVVGARQGDRVKLVIARQTGDISSLGRTGAGTSVQVLQPELGIDVPAGQRLSVPR